MGRRQRMRKPPGPKGRHAKRGLTVGPGRPGMTGTRTAPTERVVSYRRRGGKSR